MKSRPLGLRALLDCGERLRPTRPNAPEIWRTVWDGEPLLVKSYDHCSPTYRHSVGRIAIGREWWALQRLAGSGRAPQPKQLLAPWAVAMQFVEGVPLERIAPEQASALHLIAEAEGLLSELARCQIAHADLGHDYWSAQGREANLLLTAEGRLVAIDFAGCWKLDQAGWPGTRSLGRALQLHDELLITKLLYHFADDSLANHPGWLLPSGRAMAWWDLMKVLGKL